MGGAPSLNPFSFTFFPFFPIVVVTVTTTLILIASADQDHDSKENGGIPALEDDNGAATSSPPPLSSTTSHKQKKFASKPSTAVIIGILTTIVSITLLILLYIKHCSKGNVNMFNNNATDANPNAETNLQDRKNSGIERTVVEALPAFKFGSLRGQKNGLECAVCLNGFEDPEVLRLLPKCNHAFHVECVDMWLGEHSTCPLCRYKVDPDDVIIPPRRITEEESSSSNVESGRVTNNTNIPENSETSSKLSWDRDSNSNNINLRDIRSDGGMGEHKLEHRIIVSPTSCSGVQQRWSNIERCDMLYLTSDGIISENLSSAMNNRDRGKRRMVEHNRDIIDDEMENGLGGGKRYLRSVSEMTGIRRFMSSDRERRGGREEQERQREGAVLRWLNWISKSKSPRVTS
ncbi:RING-H2 finger protein ATL43-like [Cicer arietinum]|uniref:RING-type E3 ubiquitin transferase n=1 Tax=Cicer arietinum TaxID=3827 RepID=A0A3Q7Y8F7_CICAR|nr:RING-H2 finger protein ATL43-like [Cicer arietinum]